MIDYEFEYLSPKQMEVLRKKCKKELQAGTKISYLVGCVYGLYQDYVLSEEQEIELYKLIDPEEKYNDCSKYLDEIDYNILEDYLW